MLSVARLRVLCDSCLFRFSVIYSGLVRAVIQIAQQRAARCGGQRREERQPRAALQRTRRGDVIGPRRGPDAGDVRHAQGDHAGAGRVCINLRDRRAAARGHEDRDLPVVVRHRDVVRADRAFRAIAARHDEHFAAGAVGEIAAVGFETRPDALVVVGILRLDVGEDERLRAVAERHVAIGVGAHVAAIVAAVRVVGVRDALHAGRQRRVGDEVAVVAAAALVAGGETPRHPFRNAGGTLVSERVLRQLLQIVFGPGAGTTRIAERHLIAGVDERERRSGRSRDETDETRETRSFDHFFGCGFWDLTDSKVNPSPESSERTVMIEKARLRLAPAHSPSWGPRLEIGRVSFRICPEQKGS